MYVLAVTGGLEEPLFQGYEDLELATQAFVKYAEDCVYKPGDDVRLLEIKGVIPSTIMSRTYEEED